MAVQYSRVGTPHVSCESFSLCVACQLGELIFVRCMPVVSVSLVRCMPVVCVSLVRCMPVVSVSLVRYMPVVRVSFVTRHRKTTDLAKSLFTTSHQSIMSSNDINQ